MENVQKTPFSKGMNGFVDTKTATFGALQGKAYPASVVSMDKTNTIATVQIEVQDDTLTYPNIVCPVFGPQFIRYPLKKGDKGLVLSADAYMGGMSGLGGGNADLTQTGNLSNLVFFPCGNADFNNASNADKVVIGQGTKGVYLQDDAKIARVVIGPVADSDEGGPGPKNSLQIPSIIAAINDLDAKAKGVPLYGIYQNSGGVRVRIT
jgi:hypothetical protein